MELQVCARWFWTMDGQLDIDKMILLIKKNWHDWQYQALWQRAGKWSSTQCRTVRTPANINKVEDLTLGQEDKPLNQFTMEHYMTN